MCPGFITVTLRCRCSDGTRNTLDFLFGAFGCQAKTEVISFSERNFAFELQPLFTDVLRNEWLGGLKRHYRYNKCAGFKKKSRRKSTGKTSLKAATDGLSARSSFATRREQLRTELDMCRVILDPFGHALLGAHKFAERNS